MLRHRRKHGGSGHAEESDEEEEEEEEESGSDRSHRRQAEAAAAASAAKAKVRMQALWSGANKKTGMRLRGPCGSDLIGNLLGIPDTSLVEQLMSKPADDAARLLGVTGNRV